MGTIRVAFGYEDKEEDQKVNPSEVTNYSNILSFNQKLVKALNVDDIETLDQLMDRIPEFCENMRFKKIIWEELHKKESELRN